MYFDNEEKTAVLKRELESWVGTKFRHHSGVKGRGTDCIHFIIRVFEEVGALHNVKIPEYAPDWHLHRTEEKLLNGLIAIDVIEDVSEEELLNGDVALFRFGRASAHAAIYVDGYFYHANNYVKPGRVQKTNASDVYLSSRLTYKLRILK